MTKITRAAWKSRLKTNVFNIALDDNHIFGDSAKNEHTKIFEEKNTHINRTMKVIQEGISWKTKQKRFIVHFIVPGRSYS